VSNLEELLQQHTENLAKLELKQAEHGLHSPLSLANEIDYERESIADIEKRIDALRAAESMPAVEDDYSYAPKHNDMTQTLNNGRLNRFDEKIDGIYQILSEIQQEQVRMNARWEALDRRVARLEIGIPGKQISVAPWIIVLGTLAFITLTFFLSVALIVPALRGF